MKTKSPIIIFSLHAFRFRMKVKKSVFLVEEFFKSQVEINVWKKFLLISFYLVFQHPIFFFPLSVLLLDLSKKN